MARRKRSAILLALAVVVVVTSALGGALVVHRKLTRPLVSFPIPAVPPPVMTLPSPSPTPAPDSIEALKVKLGLEPPVQIELDRPRRPRVLGFLEDDSILALLDATRDSAWVELYEAKSGQPRATTVKTRSKAWSVSKEQFASVEDGELVLRSMLTGAISKKLPLEKTPGSVALSPSGGLVVLGFKKDAPAEVRATRDGALVATLEGSSAENAVTAPAFSLKEDALAAGWGEMRAWSLPDGKLRGRFQGQRIMGFSARGEIVLKELPGASPLVAFSTAGERLRELSPETWLGVLSASGEVLAYPLEHSIQVVRTDTGALLRSVTAETKTELSAVAVSLALSSSGDRLAAAFEADGHVEIWTIPR